ncbi:MAG: hypothetical protein KDI27_12445 [Gammaproteobacteria bacterium]|nr:hypothetical protein [Gammaproteobacteria bacterium]MCP5417882.1 hypothetical protein [Chromatiaceae bacterium]
MSNGKLVLQAPPDYSPISLESMVSDLHDIGLIGTDYPDRPASYLVGPRFLQLINFLGCSPNLRLEPPAGGGGDFCYIHLRGPFPVPRLLSASNTRSPRCPACGGALHQWRELEPAWGAGSEIKITCPTCQHQASAAELSWRRGAGFGHFFIEIADVYPEEALPLPGLMEHLQGKGANWRHFYLQWYKTS